MALREVTVEVTATHIIKVKASSGQEARKKAEDMVLFGGDCPDFMDSVVLDVRPIKE